MSPRPPAAAPHAPARNGARRRPPPTRAGVVRGGGAVGGRGGLGVGPADRGAPGLRRARLVQAPAGGSAAGRGGGLSACGGVSAAAAIPVPLGAGCGAAPDADRAAAHALRRGAGRVPVPRPPGGRLHAGVGLTVQTLRLPPPAPGETAAELAGLVRFELAERLPFDAADAQFRHLAPRTLRRAGETVREVVAVASRTSAATAAARMLAPRRPHLRGGGRGAVRGVPRPLRAGPRPGRRGPPARPRGGRARRRGRRPRPAGRRPDRADGEDPAGRRAVAGRGPRPARRAGPGAGRPDPPHRPRHRRARPGRRGPRLRAGSAVGTAGTVVGRDRTGRPPLPGAVPRGRRGDGPSRRPVLPALAGGPVRRPARPAILAPDPTGRSAGAVGPATLPGRPGEWAVACGLAGRREPAGRRAGAVLAKATAALAGGPP